MTATATVAVKERPIIFGADSVKAILEGRKTQTRRVLNPQPRLVANGWRLEGHEGRGDSRRQVLSCPFNPEEYAKPEARGWFAGSGCPYGKPGDRLWVRETFYCDDYRYPDGPVDEMKEALSLKADHDSNCDCFEGELPPWRSPIHMPRWASRLILEITGVRVERLQDITEADAVAEGVRRFTKDGDLMKFWMCDPCDGPLKRAWADLPRTAKDGFQHGWDALNARRGFPWESNPFVWVVEFKKVT